MQGTRPVSAPISQIELAGVQFFEAPSEVEGSPYWVDLWGFVNGYRIGLQVKPSTFNSASVATYAGNARSGQRRGHERFQIDFGGKVFTVNLIKGSVESRTEDLIKKEVKRLRALEKGPHAASE